MRAKQTKDSQTISAMLLGCCMTLFGISAFYHSVTFIIVFLIGCCISIVWLSNSHQNK